MRDIKHYTITVSGCDDSTSITRALTDEQAEFLRSIASDITAASEYGCMPKMMVEEETESR